MVLLRSGWTMSSVVELRPDSLTVLHRHWVPTTVLTLKMLESDVLVVVLKELSDFKEALLIEDVWRSATTTSGAQCVMIPGGLLMLELCASN